MKPFSIFRHWQSTLIARRTSPTETRTFASLHLFYSQALLFVIVFLGFILYGCGGGSTPEETQDNEAPDPPSIISHSGNVTIDTNTIELNGTAEVGSAIEVFNIGGVSLGTAIADESGNWIITLTALSDGEYDLTVHATDAAGNTSIASAVINITVDTTGTSNIVDTTAPGAPVITSPTNGILSNTATINVAGTAEAGSSVELFGSGSLGTTTVKSNGQWNLTTTALSDGAHSLTAFATDASGNKSASSSVVNIDIDTAAPLLKTSFPLEGATDAEWTVVLSVTFNEALAPATVNGNSFTLSKTSDGTAISGSVDISNGDTVATFTPSNKLELGTEYTATLTSAITDIATNSFGGNSWRFTTSQPPAINARYPAAPNWNDYVKASDTTVTCDSTANGGYSLCVHGGESRAVEVIDYSSCNNLQATDALGTFNWTCQSINNRTYMVSSGLRNLPAATGTAENIVINQLIDSGADFILAGVQVGDTVINTSDYTSTTVVSIDSATQLSLADDIFSAGDDYSVDLNKYLSDLIDFTTASWKNNSVTVMDGNTNLFTTTPTAWWSNPLIIDNNGGNLATAGAIYLVTANAGTQYSLTNNRIALVVQPGLTLTSNGVNNVHVSAYNFIWLEGNFNANGREEGIYMDNIAFSVLRGMIANNGDYNIWLSNASNNLLSNILTTNINLNTTSGIYLSATTDTRLENIIANSNYDGIFIETSSGNMLLDIITTNNTRDGIFISASQDINLSNITANNNAASGVYLSSVTNSTLGSITSNNNYVGVYLHNSSSNNTISNITSLSNTYSGVFLQNASNNNVTNITADNNGDGVHNWGSTNNTLSNISASSNDQAGLYLSHVASNNSMTGFFGLNNDIGIYLETATNNDLININASNNISAGVFLNNLSDDNRLENIISSNNNDGDGVYLQTSSNNSLSSIVAANNGWEGLYISNASNNNRIWDVTVTNNTNRGLSLSGSDDNTLLNITATNNGSSGVELTYSSFNNLLNITSANNALFGVGLQGNSNNNRLMNIVAANNNNNGVRIANSNNNVTFNITSSHNINYGIALASALDNTFGGLLKVGSNPSGDCLDNIGHSFTNTNCAAGPSSDIVLSQNVYLGASFIGHVQADDILNSSDTNGGADYPVDPGTFDWSLFEIGYRGWGKDETFPGNPSRGQWLTGAGRIWDWSLDEIDPVLRHQFTLPNGNSTITHNWVGPNSITYLFSAVEIMGDNQGNDNGLCESDETCLYTPNIGSYQGHGDLQSTGIFTDGTISGVSLLEHAINGY